MKKQLGDRARLLHILQAIHYVNEFLADQPRHVLAEEPIVRFAVERQLEIIGEAVNHLSDDTKAAAPSIEWRKIVAFRNFVSHEYFGVDTELLWDIATHKLEPLEQAIRQLLVDSADKISNQEPNS